MRQIEPKDKEKSMKFMFGVAALASLALSSASAADLSPRTYTKAPILASSAYDWSGVYVGGDLGWQSSDIGLSSPAAGGEVAGPLSYNPNHDGFIGGGHVGFQRQWSEFVLGFEGGYTAATGSTSFASPSVSPFFPGGTGTVNAKLDEMWSIGGRIGWAPNNWMIYATGGFAGGSFKFSASDINDLETASARLSGYYVGSGVEWAPWKNGWILGVEYRHYDFGSKTVFASFGEGTVADAVRFKPTTDTVTARISYKFGGSSY